MPLPDLITDRTKEDVEQIKRLMQIGFAAMTEEEQAQWLSGLKGAYNATDLNRVTEAMEYLAERLHQYGYSVELNIQPAEWTVSDIPISTQLNRYLSNVQTLRDAYYVLPTTPTVPPDMDRLTYQEANDIEQMLVDIEFVIQRTFRSFKRCNAFGFWCGAAPLPSAESYLGRTWKELDALNTTWDDWGNATWYLLLYGRMVA